MTSQWIRTAQSLPSARGVLLCFPHGGGTAGAYRALAAALTPKVEVLTVQYPGRQDRLMDPMVADLVAMAAAVADELQVDPTRRLGVFGHSMGATVAFEAARLLEQRGTHPTSLFVSGRPAPQIPEAARLHLASDTALLDDMRRLGGPDSQVVEVLTANPDLAEMVLPFVRSDYKAVETYTFVPGPDVSCPLTALLSTSDPTTSEPQMRAWSDRTTGAFELVKFPGGHFYIDDNLPAVAETITTRLLA
ncbi:thioesterase II family protein [Antrihabitans sp. YC2-6]|uniref:thioesterase II family protein n=1 Tax=Antrihabitans sp. YC2-6 TaxID=2799498 RepID=UPI0018F644DE|nr:alpha/beta fold hydrolase [Antrihabitans sp. YC2-6]MBJ8348430.1 thioesterase [Antrihabitans sp. YC2-6]